MQPCLGRTWARVGKSPVLEQTFDWKRLTAIVAMTSKFELFFELLEGSANSARVLCFMMDLLSEIQGKIIVLWDKGSVHKNAEVKGFLAHPYVQQRLEVHWLPGYTPELNPDELVNGQLKTHTLANYVPFTLEQLKDKATQELNAIAQNKPMLKAFLFSPTHGLFKPKDQIQFSPTGQ